MPDLRTKTYWYVELKLFFGEIDLGSSRRTSVLSNDPKQIVNSSERRSLERRQFVTKVLAGGSEF